MDEKKTRVIKAAKDVFLKYGYVKTTMNDLAKAAGISRPALYLLFAGKEEIFNDVVKYLTAELSNTVKEESQELSKPMDKLLKVFDIWVFRTYELLNQSEEAKELYQSSFPFVKESLRDSSKMFESDILDALLQFPVSQLNPNVTPQEIACVFAGAIPGFKQNSDDIKELKAKIDLLIKMSLSLLKQ